MKRLNWFDHILNFVAVILGVSLAFYISSRAEERREKEELSLLIHSFIEELETDIEVYNSSSIPYNEKQIEALAEVIGMLQEKNYDSIGFKMSTFMGYSNYAPQAVTFNSVSSSGKLDLIKDFELRKQLSIYHEVWVGEARFQGKKQIDFYEGFLMPWVLEHGNLTSLEVNEQALSQPKLTNLLTVYQSSIEQKVRNYKRVAEKATELKEQLEQRLQDGFIK